MPLISTTLPSDGENADASDISIPVLAILALLNGGLDDANIASLSGTKITAGTLPATALDSAANTGWIPTGEVWTYGSNLGGREFTVTTPGDKTAKYSPGMKVRLLRGTTPPTQAASLVSASSQYASKASPTGISYGNSFSAEAWVYIPSYAVVMIMSAGTMPNNGFQFYINSSGQVCIVGFLNSSNNRNRGSYQAIPLNRWTHVAATMDAATGNVSIYIDGVSVPTQSNDVGTTTTLTAPTGSLYLGRDSTGNYFNGYISEARLWSGVRSSSQVQSNMAINLVGSETNLLSLFKLNGTLVDTTSNANTLTAVGLTFATVNPYSTLEYGVIDAVSYSSPNTTITIFTSTANTIPNQILSTISYSLVENAYGLPGGLGTNRILGFVQRLDANVNPNTTAETDVPGLTASCYVPSGRRLRVTFMGMVYNSSASSPVLTNIKEGSSILRTGKYANAINLPSGQNYQWEDFPTPGLHTYKISMSAPSGSSAIEINATESASLRLELVG